MKHELQQLLKLQAIDLGILEIEQEIDRIPVLLRESGQRIEDTENRIKDTKNTLQQVQLRKKEKEIEIESFQTEIKKRQSELYTVKTNEAYAMLLKEIEDKKKGIAQAEESLIAIMEEEEQTQGALKEYEKLLADTRKNAEKQKAELRQRQGIMEKTLEEKCIERNAASKDIPAAILGQYDALRKRKGGLAIVPVRSEYCGGCNISLLPAIISELIGGKEITVCNNCSCILYIPDENEKIP